MKGAAYFANCDTFTSVLDIAASTPTMIQDLAGRNDDKLIKLEELERYESLSELKQSH